MRRRNNSGYVLTAVLILSFVLAVFLSVVVSVTYRLHEQNARLAKELQARAQNPGRL